MCIRDREWLCLGGRLERDLPELPRRRRHPALMREPGQTCRRRDARVGAGVLLGAASLPLRRAHNGAHIHLVAVALQPARGGRDPGHAPVLVCAGEQQTVGGGGGGVCFARGAPGLGAVAGGALD
eukprot:2516422-Rhodomonas_salina.1